VRFFFRAPDSKRISEVEERLSKLERDFHTLELEWTVWFDKARRLLMRVTKRAEIVEKADEADQVGQRSAAPFPLHPAVGRLNDRQREIQEQIMKRRAGG
jgi:hypothetical protein